MDARVVRWMVRWGEQMEEEGEERMERMRPVEVVAVPTESAGYVQAHSLRLELRSRQPLRRWAAAAQMLEEREVEE